MNPACSGCNDHGLIIFLSLLLFFLSTPLFSSDVNIKLRKTDINELKQQLLPIVENNISLLKTLQNCLVMDNGSEFCLDNYAQTFSVSNNISERGSSKKRQIISDLKKEITKELQQDKIIENLKKLIAEAESVKDCILKGKNANELKNCFVKYKS